ncbi:YkvA family protein [Oceanicaulis sp. MMSF_3324]|uniref:YkvA family protein n=1 Tax=Oceanicaulis sp. MMSF_3324 TaxID=3046702 RepID=UPI00273F85AF|nr:YkvA family protein [Oceanicaulis sp. MMSF_3324]
MRNRIETFIFRRGKGDKALENIQSRAEKAYAPLYKEGRTKALDRAEELARQRVEEASTRTEAEFERDEAKVEANFWPKVQRVARQIPFLEDLVAAYYAMRDPNAPLKVRAALALGLLYFLWIFDIIPDFLGLIGYADDGTVLTTIILQVGGAITDDHRSKARQALGLPPLPPEQPD